MAISIDDFTLDKQYVDGDILEEDDLDAAFNDADVGSVQYYLNNKVIPNLIQFALDVMPTSWEFNDDGLKSVTNTIYNKQTEEFTYASGDIDIATSADLDYDEVDATYAAVTFSPEYIGKYKVTCQFNNKLIGVVAGAGDIEAELRFRISDGTTASAAAKVHWMETSTGAGDPRTNETPITLTLLLDVLSTASDVTVYLFKKNDTMTEITDNEVSASAGDGQLYFLVEKV